MINRIHLVIYLETEDKDKEIGTKSQPDGLTRTLKLERDCACSSLWFSSNRSCTEFNLEGEKKTLQFRNFIHTRSDYGKTTAFTYNHFVSMSMC